MRHSVTKTFGERRPLVVIICQGCLPFKSRIRAESWRRSEESIYNNSGWKPRGWFGISNIQLPSGLKAIISSTSNMEPSGVRQ